MRIDGGNIYLRPLSLRDSDSLLIALSDPEIRFLTNTHSNFTRSQIEEHIEKNNQDNSRYDFAICDIEDDSYIGELSILDIDLDNLSAGFRIAINKQANMNKGYGSEAISLVLDFVFNHLELNRLELEVYSHNQRAIRAYEKAGFIKEGVLRQAIIFKDQYYDEIIMAILKDDYL